MVDGDFIGMDMCRKFLEMGFTRSRRYANHHSGKKYDDEGNVRPQEPDHATCDFAKSAQIFKKVRDLVAKNATYVTCLLYTSPSPRDVCSSRMPSSA